MKMTITQAQAFIRKGEIPIEIMFLTRLLFNLYMSRFKCNSSLLLVNSFICQQSAKTCDITVAKAAPLMPQCHQRMNTTSSRMFIPTVKIVANIAIRGFDAARNTAFIPKYMCENTLPASITCMKSRAYGRVASLAPKKRKIGSRNKRQMPPNAKPTIRFRVMVLPRMFSADS